MLYLIWGFWMNKSIRSNRLDEDRVDDIVVPEIINNSLPSGYGKWEIASDMIQNFDDKKSDRNDVREISKEWTEAAISEGNSRKPPAASKAAAVDYSRFYSKFPKTRLHKEILEYTGDSKESANLLLSLMEQEMRRIGSGSPIYGTNALRRILKDAHKGLRIPEMLKPREESDEDKDGKKCSPSKGKHGGSHLTREGISRLWDLRDLIDQLRIEYEPYSERVDGIREIPYPDQFIDIVPLRSFSSIDICRVTTSDYLLDDDEFYMKLSKKELKQTIYHEQVPAPPRKFSMLIDVSGSMGTDIKNDFRRSNGDAYHRYEYAIASAICLLESAFKGSHEVIFRSFDGMPHEPIRGNPIEIANHLLTMPFCSGDEQIVKALKVADEDGSDEIILLTDGGGDREDFESLIEMKTPITCYRIGEWGSDRLRAQCKQFHEVN